MSWWEGPWKDRSYWNHWGDGWWNSGSWSSGPTGTQWGERGDSWQSSGTGGSNWPTYTDEQMAEWNRTRYNEEETKERKEKLLKEGLKGRGKFEFMDDLGAIVLNTRNSPLSKEPLEFNLHVSIGYKSDINPEDLEHLEKTYGQEQDFHFKFSWIGSGLSGNLDPENDRVAKDQVVQRLYRDSIQKAGPLHMSL